MCNPKAGTTVNDIHCALAMVSIRITWLSRSSERSWRTPATGRMWDDGWENTRSCTHCHVTPVTHRLWERAGLEGWPISDPSSPCQPRWGTPTYYSRAHFWKYHFWAHIWKTHSLELFSEPAAKGAGHGVDWSGGVKQGQCPRDLPQAHVILSSWPSGRRDGHSLALKRLQPKNHLNRLVKSCAISPGFQDQRRQSNRRAGSGGKARKLRNRWYVPIFC